jgi:hypothetical protein
MEYLFDVVKSEKRIPDLHELRAREDWRYAGKELYWLQSLDAVKDSVMWFIKETSKWYMDNGTPQGLDYLKQHCLSRDAVTYAPIDLFYSFVQEGIIKPRRAYGLLRIICKTTLRYARLHKSEWRLIAGVPHITSDTLQTLVMAFATAGQVAIANSKILSLCAPEFLRKPFDYKRVLSLLRDTQCGVHSIVSMNQLQQLHDEQAAVARQRARLEDKGLYFYRPEFVTMAERFGWRLPESAEDLVERGEVHHNCVASYRAKHTTSVTPRRIFSRLLLRDDATCEVQFSYGEDGKMLVCNNQQCKGMRNKDMPFGNWFEFRKEFMELDKDSLEVEVRYPEEVTRIE